MIDYWLGVSSDIDSCGRRQNMEKDSWKRIPSWLGSRSKKKSTKNDIRWSDTGALSRITEKRTPQQTLHNSLNLGNSGSSRPN